MPLRDQALARTTLVVGALVGALALWGGCAKQESPSSPPPAPAPAAPAAAIEIPNVQYVWDPKAGDPAVSAEMGGPGFTGEGWTTRMEFPAIGDARAVKGGRMTLTTTDWPATLRLHGKDYNESLNYMIVDMCLESLLTVHPTTLEFIPQLATHWKISEDRSTYTYRINPEARWNDGSEVTADDVVATWKLRVDEKCLFPSSVMTYGKLEEPRALSKYIVEVKVKEENWRNFLYFSGMPLFPAKDVSIPGDVYLDKFQNAYTAMSGPYTVLAEDIAMGESLTLTRRSDWWARNNPAYTGVWNIDKIKVIVIKDPSIAFEKAKKGEIDYYAVPSAEWWVKDVLTLEQVKRGLIVPKKIYNDAPIGTQGLAINVKRPPLDNPKVRMALQLLMNRPQYIEKLFYNEYEPLTSYYQGGTYGNPANQLYPFDPQRAAELLAEAGYTEINQELLRMKDGKPLTLTVSYGNQLSEKWLTIFQEDCRDAGIKIELQLLTPAAAWKNLTEKQFELAATGWGGLVFPNPETSFHGRLAEVTGNNNVTAFANARVDELCAAYDREYDVQKRIELIREIDGILYREQPYALGWFNPAQRVMYWNKFQLPPWGAMRTNDVDSLHYVWWVDPAKEKALEQALADPSKSLPREPIDNRFWQDWNRTRTSR